MNRKGGPGSPGPPLACALLGTSARGIFDLDVDAGGNRFELADAFPEVRHLDPPARRRKRPVANGAESLPITDPRMTRFWITLTQGVNFVLSSMEMMRGGEIYVPKIPSTTIPELAHLISPAHKQQVIGIRPGEKLHETMIPADDAHCTVELEDRYVILQSFANAARDAYLHRGAKPVPEGFCYSSDSNPEALNVHGLQALLQLAYA